MGGDDDEGVSVAREKEKKRSRKRSTHTSTHDGSPLLEQNDEQRKKKEPKRVSLEGGGSGRHSEEGHNNCTDHSGTLQTRQSHSVSSSGPSPSRAAGGARACEKREGGGRGELMEVDDESSLIPSKRVNDEPQGGEREELQRQRQTLPIYSARQEILFVLKRNDTLVLVGETGSGKTTQIPQYLREAGYTRKGALAVTQPRRVAAIMVSTRVAHEVGVTLGEEVGYSVRFDDKSSSRTQIKFLTDGMLVRELMLDPTLKRYSVVILDEAHERTLSTEVLFSLIKRLQLQRKETNRPLKVIVMSATLEAKAYADFFLNSKVLHVSGRRFPVEILYTPDPQPDYVDATVVAVLQIHLEQGSGDILVFLCGSDEIENVCKVLRERGRALPPSASKLLPCPMYAALPPAQQLAAFEPTPTGTRKVILATNIAESSITIEGIRYVVDAGLVKSRIYEPKNDMEILREVPVSKAQAQQRSGRAGRMTAGKCFRLYTEDQYEELKESAVPEIKRCRLSSMVLQLKVIGIDNLIEFQFMDPPPKRLLMRALEQLYLLGAVDANNHVTDLGTRMAMLPLEPLYAKLLISSADFGCSEEVLTIVAMVSVESILYAPAHQKEEAARAHRALTAAEGDHVTLLQVYNEWVKHKKSNDWCKENFVNSKNMKRASEVRKQLQDYCQQVKVDLVSCKQDTIPMCRCLVTALFANAATLAPSGNKYKLETTAEEVNIHPSSSLFQRKPTCLIFDQLIFSTKLYMRNCTAIDAEWLPELVPHMYRKKGTTAKIS